MVSVAEIKTVFSLLERTHPLTMLEELGHYTPFQMLVMTMLSARARDSTTIPVVKEMFARYPGPSDYTTMPLEKLEGMIRRIGFFRAKARNVKALSVMLIEKFDGKVPDTLEELVLLPGVGRKTANCMLAYCFKKQAIAVDIHVHRISNRLGWVTTTKESETEKALLKIVPKSEWINVNRLLVGHGQTICRPVNPLCGKCGVLKYCEFGRKRVL